MAIIPALAFGAAFKSHIEVVLGKPLVIAIVLLTGGIILLFIDRFFKSAEVHEDEDITYRHAFMIGLYQVLAIVFPGLSRSAATIIGGMQQKLSRSLAAEFSFYLAVPTMMAATLKSVYDVYKKSPAVLKTENLTTLFVGSVIAFGVSILAIRFLITYLQKNGFRMFGWYRIVVGLIMIGLILGGKIPA